MNFRIDELKYDDNGLIPAIVQDATTNEVLMLAYMNKDSLEETIKVGKTCFWSRSRKKYWVKGETSGHVQHVKNIYYDCDRDTLLIKAEQIGAACHEGYKSCFFTEIEQDQARIISERIFDPNQVYKK
ncbi:MAG: phosphoribosyl-AMP cyclohydrolase [Chlamydiota bacterium]|nr:phosphoribosyl-AMP cyclohydrolase [Chlamydiota bacterium]